MKTTKVFLLLAAALLIVAPAYDSAWAAQRGQAPEAPLGSGPWQYPAIAPEKRAAFDKIFSEYHSKAQPLQNDLWAKRTELEYLSRADKANSKDINRLVTDMKNLREKMQELHNSAAVELAKDLNITNAHAYALLGRGGGRGLGPCADLSYGGHRGGYDGHRGGHGGYRGWHR